MTGPWRAAAPKDAIPRTRWWTLYGVRELDGLEDGLLGANQTLQVSLARLDQARAAAAAQDARLFPTLSAGASAGRQRYSGNRSTGTQVPLSPTTQASYILPFTASYEVDLSGARRRAVEAAQAATQASAADLESVRLVLTADLAVDYFTLRQLDTQIAALERTVEILRKGLELVQSRHRGGLASGLDVAQEETLFDASRTQATLLQSQRKQQDDAIAVLTGQAAPDFHLGARELAAEPPALDPGLPSDLLERRPDIAEAERQMALASAQIGISSAPYFHSLSLSAQGGWNASTGAVASYRGTVLNAFREVQDGLTGLEVLDAAHRSQSDAVASSRHQLEIATSRYAGGVVNHLDVVTAQQNLLGNEQQAAVIQGQRLVTSVLLVKALGGGWDAASLAAVQAKPRLADAVAP